MKFGACAPSNIALVKYMGKKEGAGNLPENGSLSMTLNRLCTIAEATLTDPAGVKWIPELPRLRAMQTHLAGSTLKPSVPDLNGDGIAKVAKHVERVRANLPALFEGTGLTARSGSPGFELRTANTFPAASGIASSASAFAAITLAVAGALAADPAEFQRVYSNDTKFRRRLASVSRQGSGSSCRSFEGPFVFWDDETTLSVPSKLGELSHFVLVVSDRAKRVSSSQAHAMIKTSPLWNGRVGRVGERLNTLKSALSRGNLGAIADLTWSEAWEMHSLFHTAREPFSYWEPASMAALQFLSPFIRAENPPIVTLDAGPNVHLIVRSSDTSLWRERLRKQYPSETLLEDSPGNGAFFLAE